MSASYVIHTLWDAIKYTHPQKLTRFEVERPCQECIDNYSYANMGSNRKTCKTCNRYNQAVLRKMQSLALEQLSDEERETIKELAISEVYPRYAPVDWSADNRSEDELDAEVLEHIRDRLNILDSDNLGNGGIIVGEISADFEVSKSTETEPLEKTLETGHVIP